MMGYGKLHLCSKADRGSRPDPDGVLCGSGPITDKLWIIIAFGRGGPILIGIIFLAFTVAVAARDSQTKRMRCA